MPQKYRLTANSDSWWLRLQLEDYEDGLASATVKEATISDRPLAANSLNSEMESVLFQSLRSGSVLAQWSDAGRAFYVEESGVIDIPLTQWFSNAIVGSRLHFRVVTSGQYNLIAAGEIVWVRDKSRTTSPEDVQVCEDDSYLSFRLTDEEVTPEAADSVCLGEMPLAASNDSYSYALLARGQGAMAWSQWFALDDTAWFEPRTRIVDVAIGPSFANAVAGDKIQYVLAKRPVSGLLDQLGEVSPEAFLDFIAEKKSLGHAIDGGEMTYSPGECDETQEDETPETNRYDVTAAGNAKRIRFRLRNYDVNPSLAVVTSVSVGRPPSPLDSGSGTFLLRYRDTTSASAARDWRYLSVFFSAVDGVAEVDISGLISGGVTSMDFRLVSAINQEKILAYGTMSVSEEEDEGASRPACSSEPIVDVILSRTSPSLSLSASPGSGATLVPVLVASGPTGEQTWGVHSVVVASGGGGYADGAKVSISPSTRTVAVSPADLVIAVDRSEPTFVASVESSEGSGADLSFSYSPVGSAWELSGVTINSGGQGYDAGDKVAAVAGSNTFDSLGTPAGVRYGIEVSQVGDNGEISGVSLSEFSGQYYSSNGVIQSVAVDDSGEYYATDSVSDVVLVYGGSFYPAPACEYTWKGCAACCENNKMAIAFKAGSQEHTLKATRIDVYGSSTPIFEAVTPAEGGDWTNLTFESESFYPGVESIAVTAGGSGYTSPPTVTITGDGSGAEAVATVKGYVDSITLTNQGSGYTSSPTVKISGGGGTGATATAYAWFSTPIQVYLGAGGSGYTSPPTVTISGGGGSGATAVATIRQAVDTITVTKAGSGYTAPPTVTLSGGEGSGAVAVATLDRQPVGCYTSGTATLAAASCTDTSEKDLPDQISMTLAGIAPIFWWVSQNGGAPGGPCAAEGGASDWGNVFCGRCEDAPENGIRYRIVGNAFGTAGYALQQAIDNFSVVLDREQTDSCQTIVYSGYTKSLPSAGYSVLGNDTYVGCGGELNVPVSLTLSCVALSTAVSISAPTKGATLENATAEITGISDGVVSGLTLTNPGSGYAVEIVERIEPEVEAGVSTSAGVGGELSVSLSAFTDYDGNQFWTVDSVTVLQGGDGYAPSEPVYFSTSDEEYGYAEAYIKVATTEPTISAAASGGSGAELSVTLAETTDYFGNKFWGVDAVTVDAGGTGYTDGSAVTFTVDDGDMQSAASATIVTAREEPEVTATVASGTGSGAVLSVTLTQSGNSWYVSGVTVVDGGAGYDGYYSDYVVFATGDTEASQAYAAITTDGNGTITAVSMYGGGSYYRATSVIESVTVTVGGAYYKSDGAIESVVVTAGGAYVRLQGTGEADADTPTVTISGSYGVGSGAAAEATVDTTVGSPTFGQISSLTLTSGGSGYRTQVSGWRATVNIDRLIHRTECLVFGVYSGCDEEGEGCPGFADSYKEPESERVTDGNYPTPLINKAYKMAFAAGTRYGEIANAENAVYCTSGPYAQQLVIVDMGLGDIVVTVSPA